MDEAMKMLLSNMSPQERVNFFVNLNRRKLNGKKHIKKYNKLRKLHSDITASMQDYIESGKYPAKDYFNSVTDDIYRESKNLEFFLDNGNVDDATIIGELFMYKTHPKIESLTDIFLAKNKFRSEDKVKMLHSMQNSYVGLFKVVKIDRDEGYVYYEDVFTHKKFKIIDISLSSSFVVNNNRTIYFYNRVITFDDISFATGIHCMATSDNKYLNEFIKKHKYDSCSDFTRCLLLYDISKKEENVKIEYNNKYGNGN